MASKFMYDLKMKIEGLKRGEIPDTFPDLEKEFFAMYSSKDRYSYEDRVYTFQAREEYTNRCGFAIISKEWVQPLAKFIGKDKCLEIMAGTGLLSKALKDEGIDVICTDNLSWEGCKPDWSNHFTEIENLDCVKAIEKYGKDVKYIIMSWAPYQGEESLLAYRKMKEVNPDAVMIYIGEYQGGCTACDEFFEETEMRSTMDYFEDGDEIPSELTPELRSMASELNFHFPSFDGIHDRIAFVV